MTYPYIFHFGNNEKRASLKGRACRIIARGTQNSRLIEFENGQREVVSGNALRKRNGGAKLQLESE